MRVSSVRNFAVYNSANNVVKNNQQNATAPSFGAIPIAKAREVVQKSLFGFDLSNVNVQAIERNLQRRGVDADFSVGSEYARRFIARGCEITTDIFEKLGLARPKKVMSYDFAKISQDDAQHTIAICYDMFVPISPLSPPRTVAFNASRYFDWQKYPETIAQSYASGHSSTGHILGPFIHDFAHSALADNMFKRHGTKVPVVGYFTNPDFAAEMNKLSNKYPQNSRIQEALGMVEGKISKYATTTPHETYAEALTKKIVTEYLQLFTYDVKPPSKYTPRVGAETDAVINEIWNGLINDGRGLI